VSALPPAAATEASAPPPTAGWFGKIPALGDFVSRRLPPEFIDPWDEWLSEELFGAREKLGENWLESYLKAPIWRFALMPGALDDRHWFGVLTPSVDRVGRQFPLTFAASFAPEAGTLHRWWSTLVGIAMRAKEPDCDADALEAALLTSPALDPGPTVEASPLTSDAMDRGPTVERFETQVAPSVATAAAGTSVWWCWRREAPEDRILSVVEGLPRGDRFLQLIAPDSSD
jgi:type VI secretion system protein ImpM